MQPNADFFISFLKPVEMNTVMRIKSDKNLWRSAEENTRKHIFSISQNPEIG